jgi:protein-S-isoprenylcysteine O-methyltransferase Ste14
MKNFLPPQFVLVCLLLMFLLHWLFPTATILPFPFNLIGLLPFLLGFVVMMAADRHFQQVGTNIKTFNEPGKLVTDGWFRFSRNPMYLGFQGILKVAIVLPPRRQICQVRQDSFGFLGALYKNLASLAVII